MGSEAGNLALKVLAVGGVYLAGRIAVHLQSALKSPRFLQSFRRKGRFSEVMTRIAVHLMIGKWASPAPRHTACGGPWKLRPAGS